jgi:polyphosphate kinase 2
MPENKPIDESQLIRRVHRELIDDYDEELEMERRRLGANLPRRPVAPAGQGFGQGCPEQLFQGAFPAAGRAREDARLGGGVGAQDRHCLRGARRRRQGWRHQAHHPAPESARGPGRGAPAPSSRERTQWYFQRYVAHLPAAGEIVLFDRSWYNRAGVERVMGFCTDAEYEEFFRSVPEFEKMLIRSGIQLVKYWFSIPDEEQEFRFRCRINDPLKQWKLSPMDLESRKRWELYTKAKEVMFERTHIPESPWWVVQGADKKKARLNCIHHLLSLIKVHRGEAWDGARVTLPAGTRPPRRSIEATSPEASATGGTRSRPDGDDLCPRSS